jgi:hypothetical protein
VYFTRLYGQDQRGLHADGMNYFVVKVHDFVGQHVHTKPPEQQAARPTLLIPAATSESRDDAERITPTAGTFHPVKSPPDFLLTTI